VRTGVLVRTFNACDERHTIARHIPDPQQKKGSLGGSSALAPHLLLLLYPLRILSDLIFPLLSDLISSENGSDKMVVSRATVPQRSRVYRQDDTDRR
jgi:hypothetical protein